MATLHKKLSSTAIKLSVYSALLDFGLTLSVLLLNSKYLPAGITGFLVNIFDNAITYLSLVIIAFFAAAFLLKYKERVVNVYLKGSNSQVKIKKIVVYKTTNAITEKQGHTAIIPKAASPEANAIAQRFVNRKNESFIRFNGNWYKSENERFEKVSRPDYS